MCLMQSIFAIIRGCACCIEISQVNMFYPVRIVKVLEKVEPDGEQIVALARLALCRRTGTG